MSPSENKAIVRRLFEGLTQKNLALIDELFSPDIVIHTGAGSAERSLEEIKQRSFAVVQMLPDLRLTIEDMLAEGDKVSVRYSFEGTMPPIGQERGSDAERSLSGTGMAILRLAHGKIRETWNEGGTTHRISTYGPTRSRRAPER